MMCLVQDFIVISLLYYSYNIVFKIKIFDIRKSCQTHISSFIGHIDTMWTITYKCNVVPWSKGPREHIRYSTHNSQYEYIKQYKWIISLSRNKTLKGHAHKANPHKMLWSSTMIIMYEWYKEIEILIW